MRFDKKAKLDASAIEDLRGITGWKAKQKFLKNHGLIGGKVAVDRFTTAKNKQVNPEAIQRRLKKRSNNTPMATSNGKKGYPGLNKTYRGK